MIKTLFVLTALWVSVAPIAQGAKDVPWEGTWKLNVVQSRFQPGPPAKSGLVTIASDGKVTYEGVNGDGNSSHWVVTPDQGKQFRSMACKI